MKRVMVQAVRIGEAEEVLVDMRVVTPDSDDMTLGIHMPERSWQTLGHLLLDGMRREPDSGNPHTKLVVHFFDHNPNLVQNLDYTEGR